MSKRTLFVGDVHGCYMELKGLLEMANFKPDSEKLFLVGDLINRGPKPLEVLKLSIAWEHLVFLVIMKGVSSST